MKIIHITPSYKPSYHYGGPTLSVSQLCESEVDLGEEVEVYTTSANGKSELDVERGKKIVVDGVTCIYFSRLTGDHSHFSPGVLWYFLRNVNKNGLIHIHSWWNLVTIPVLLLCILKGIKPILSPRGMLSPYTFRDKKKFLFHQYIGKFLLKRSVLHFTSKKEMEEATPYLSNVKSFILPNIIELPANHNNVSSSNQKYLRIVFLSRIHPVKGLELLFEALGKLKSPFHLQIAGDGEAKYLLQLKEKADNLQISSYIEWLGWQDKEGKLECLANADLFVLPSQSESFANVVIESLALGTPVLISDQVGLSDYVMENQLGWIAPLQPDAWTSVLETIWQSKEQLSHIRKIAPVQIREDFAPNILASKYLKAYQTFLIN